MWLASLDTTAMYALLEQALVIGDSPWAWFMPVHK